MPSTPTGLPYPNPTDPVSLGANDIRALAEAVDKLGVPRLVSTLDGLAPTDGMQVRLLVDAAAGVAWHLAYRAASSSAFKWEYLGGPPLQVEDLSRQSGIASTTFVDLAPSLILPRAGDYDWTIGAQVEASAGSVAAYLGVQIGAAPATNDDAAYHYLPSHTGTVELPLWRSRRSLGAAAGAVVKLMARVSSGQAAYSHRTLSVTPVRLS